MDVRTHKAAGRVEMVAARINQRRRAHVVAALLVDCLEDPQEMLITQRGMPKEVYGMWEFPGGKIEEGEQPHDALQRELREELGISVKIGEEFSHMHSRDRGGWLITSGKLMRLWFVQLSAGTPQLLETQSDMQWVKFYDEYGKANQDLLTIDWMRTNIPVVKELLRQLALSSYKLMQISKDTESQKILSTMGQQPQTPSPAKNTTAPEITEHNTTLWAAAAETAFNTARTIKELKEARLTHLGDKSVIASASRSIGSLEPQHKAIAGKLLGQVRKQINTMLSQRTLVLEEAETQRVLQEETVDVTAAPWRRYFGARHPLTLLQDKVSDIFVSMGWEIAEGPEIEHEWYNFDALNFPPDHPARAMQDTFFIADDDASGHDRHLLLRTHTSPVQIRALLERQLPIYVLSPGKVFRTDELDATHTPVFNQFEALAVDKNLSMADMKGILEHFAKLMFGPDAKIRLRPSYFPFTEPSAELDVWHADTKGGPQWVEWGGCGMVNPKVLTAVGVNPEEYSGFAFGMGVERTLMFRNGVKDMRDMIEGDQRFSQNFGMEV